MSADPSGVDLAERRGRGGGPAAVAAACAACVAAMALLAAAHALRVDHPAGDDLLWLDLASRGPVAVWTEPSALRLFRPVFGTWLWALTMAGAASPSGLAVAGLLVSLAVAGAALWAVRTLLPLDAALVAATLLLIHPARQQHQFWMSAHADALCLALSLVCLGVAVRAGPRPRVGRGALAALSFATAGAVLSKEIGLLLPAVVALLPGTRDLSRRLAMAGASLAGAVAAAAASLAVLGGTGRPGGLFGSAGSLASLAYPVRLVWPGDHGAWRTRALLAGDPLPLLGAAGFTLGMALLVAWSLRGCRRQRWARCGLLLLAAGLVPWVIRQDDRSIGLGLAGLAVIVAGTATRLGPARGRAAALLLLVVALVWSPLWVRWESRWTEAARVSRLTVDAWRAWRAERGAGPLLIAVGSVSMVGPGAEVTGLAEVDRCAVDLLGLVGPPPVMPPRVRRAPGSPELIAVEATGDSFFRWGWTESAAVGILDIRRNRAGQGKEALLDPLPVARSAASRLCRGWEIRRWDGRRFLPLPPLGAGLSGD